MPEKARVMAEAQIYTFMESDDWDPHGDDRLRLYWDHPLFPGQWSLRFCFCPFPPKDPPTDSCVAYAHHPWPRQALARHLGLEGTPTASLPAEELFRLSPAELAARGAQDHR